MKKLLVMMAAAASALGLMAADPTTYASEDFEDSAKFQDGKLIIGGETGWSCADEGATLTQGTYLDGEAFAGTRNPAFTGENLKYLNLKTTFGKPLEHAVSATVGDDSLYFDQLVKMTATDAEPDLTGYTSPKIVIYAIDRSEEDTPVAETNLMVVAGQYVGGELTTATYNLGPIDVDAWHRLTIKTIKAYNNSAVAFEIFVDGIAKAYLGNTKAYDSTAVANLTVTAKALNAAQKLFPSLVADASITAVAFDGQGQIDDFIATEVSPGTFTDDKFFMLGWDAKVTALSYTAHGETVVVDDMTTQPISIPYAENMTVTVTPTFAENWVLDEITGENINPVGNVISVLSESANATITSKDATPRMAIEINGESVGTAPSFAAALETINALVDGTAKITLNQDIELTDSDTETEAFVKSGAEVEIDLAGRTITGPASYEFAVIEAESPLTISDSSEEKTGRVILTGLNTAAVEMINGSDAKLTITGGTFEGPVTALTSEVFGGAFKKGEEQEFPLTCADGYEADGTTVEGYWTIGYKSWTITYLLDDESTEFARDTYTLGNRATKELNAGTREGYTFQEWTLDGETITSLAEQSGDLTLIGVWEEDVTYVAQIEGGDKYATLKEAIDAAEDGDKIVFLADIDADAAIVVNKSLTFDATGYTFTGAKDVYAIQIVSNATLTIVGGDFTSYGEPNENWELAYYTSNSLFLVGDSEDTLKTGEQTGKLIVQGADTALYGNCGNLIKLSKGEVQVDNGTLTQLALPYKSSAGKKTTGSRCVKADGADTKLTLNGGKIAANDDKTAVCVDRGGQIEVNGGEIAGKFSCDSEGGSITIKGGVINGTISIANDKGKITVPNMVDGQVNPVKFKQDMTPFNIFERGFATVGPDKDGFYTIGVATYTITVTDGETTLASYQMNTEAAQTATLTFTGTVPESKVFDVWKLTKATGFEAEAITVEGNTLTIAAGAIGNVSLEPTFKDDIVPVDPTQPISGKTVDEVNKNLDKYLKVPEGVTDAGAYREMFEAKAGPTEGTVVIDLKSAVEDEIEAELANEATSGSMLAPEDGKVTITARPGLYYGIKAVNDVKAIGAAEGQKWTMATGTTVEVERPVVEGNAAFFQAVCSPAAKK